MEEQGFDLVEYVRRRMLEIEDIKDRRLFRQIVEETILKVHEYNRCAYQELEERVLEECRLPKNRYAIFLTLTDLAHYDVTDCFMYPMCREDLQVVELSCAEIEKQLNQKEEVSLYTVFIKANAAEIGKLCSQPKRRFGGRIKTKYREYRAAFCLRRQDKYLKQIESLYSIFLASGQPWTTVCTAYLNKLFELCLTECEEMKGEEKILEIIPDFEEYGDVVEYDVFPLWNLKRIQEKSSTYPEPCINKINYEHQIYSQRLDPECEYLVCNPEVEITGIRRQRGDLLITCPEEKPWEWQLYEIHPDRGTREYPYPVLSNQQKDSFSANLTEMYRMSIKTKGEMARLVEAYPYDDYMEFHDFILCDALPDQLRSINYNMDGFLMDELRINRPGQPMIIEFKAEDKSHYLNEDIMSFLVTQVQKILPEFICMGRLV